MYSIFKIPEDVKLLTDEAMMINMISGIIIIRVVSLHDFSSIYCTKGKECFAGLSLLYY